MIAVQKRTNKMRSREREVMLEKRALLRKLNPVKEEKDIAMDDATLGAMEPEEQHEKEIETEQLLKEAGFKSEDEVKSALDSMMGRSNSSTPSSVEEVKKLAENFVQQHADDPKEAKRKELQRAIDAAKKALQDHDEDDDDNQKGADVAGQKLDAPELKEEDFALPSPEAEESEEWTPEKIKEQIRRALQASSTAISMAEELNSAKWVRLILFLPRGWKPQWLQERMCHWEKMGWINWDNGLVGMSERATPACMFARSSHMAGWLQQAVGYCSRGEVRSVVDQPSETAQQLHQFRDCLRFLSAQAKMNSAKGTDLTNVIQVSRPRRRPRTDRTSENDWWSLSVKVGNEKEPVTALRCEYNHERFRQNFTISKRISKLYKISRAEWEEHFRGINQYYRWWVDIVDEPFQPAHPLKTMEKIEAPADEEDDWQNWDHSWKSGDAWSKYLQSSKGGKGKTKDGKGKAKGKDSMKGKDKGKAKGKSKAWRW